MGTLLAEQTDEWQVTRRYMSEEKLARVLSDEDKANFVAQPEAARRDESGDRDVTK